MNPQEVFIVGGGPSLAGFNFHLLDRRDVIAINQSFVYVPNAKYICTMDYIFRRRLEDPGQERNKSLFLNHKAEKVFVVGFAAPRLKILGPHLVEDSSCHIQYDLRDFSKVVFCSEYGGIGTSWEDFHVGSDSGYSGLQLASILGYTRIYLLGFDFSIHSAQTHFHHDYPSVNIRKFKQNLNEYYQVYPEAFLQLRSRGVEVFSCSPMSLLNAHLLYVDPEKLLCQA